MSRLRRFVVETLGRPERGSHCPLRAAERRHLGVLRMTAGSEVEVLDGEGRCWRARLLPGLEQVELLAPAAAPEALALGAARRFVLACAWPKGKRASLLVEKCTELGVAAFYPLACQRSVVFKRGESAGMERLRRVAQAAAKQSRRQDLPLIGPPLSVQEALALEGLGSRYVLEPSAPLSLREALERERLGVPATASSPGGLLFLLGPEGGFTPEELQACGSGGALSVNLGERILRVETAAIAVCALAGAFTQR